MKDDLNVFVMNTGRSFFVFNHDKILKQIEVERDLHVIFVVSDD